jgi:hypothetical protein
MTERKFQFWAGFSRRSREGLEADLALSARLKPQKPIPAYSLTKCPLQQRGKFHAVFFYE